MEIFNNIVARIRSFWAESSPLVRALTVVGTLLVVGGLSYAVSFEPERDLTPLAEQPLSLQQVGRITEELQKRGIPYKVVDSGTQVLVPRERRGDLLAGLASAGISAVPEGGGALESSILATDFQQREQVRQQLERSLARDIASMRVIEWAEVHISPGSDSVFSRDKRAGAASVVVKVRPGFSFPKSKAMSLKHLVAQAAHRYGVTSDSVTVVDHEARTLASAEQDTELGRNSKAMELQRTTEDDLAARVRSLLEPVVGVGRVRVQVRTKMDLNRVEERAEQYDPDNSTVLSQRKTSEASRSQSQTPATVAGTPGNIPQDRGAEASRGRSRSNQDRAIDETNFAVPKVVRHTKRAIGIIERMSVAVLVDATAFADPRAPVEATDPPQVATEGSEAEEETEADASDEPLPTRPNQEMLLALVRDAVAFDAERGDTVTLSFQPFIRVSSEAQRVSAEEPGLAMPGWIPITIVTFIGFVLVGAALYLSERRRQREEAERAAAEAAAEQERAQGEQADAKTPELHLRDRVRQITSENLGGTVEIIKGWLSTTPQKG